MGGRAFLETVRELLGEEGPAQPTEAAASGPAEEDARTKLARAGVQLLEALAAVLAESSQQGTAPLPAETLQRGAAALQAILQSLGVKNEAKGTEPERNGP